MVESYYRDLLESGVKLNSCIMVHNAYHSYFMSLQSQYPDVKVHSFGGDKCYLDYAVRRYPNNYRYEFYDLFLLSSSRFFDEDYLEELEELAEKMSQVKRVTLGYAYPVKNQGHSSYIVESFLNGIKDFTTEGELEELMSDSSQMIDIMAEVHMELLQTKKQNLLISKKITD